MVDIIDFNGENFFNNSGYELIEILGYSETDIKKILFKPSYKSYKINRIKNQKLGIAKRIFSIIGSFSIPIIVIVGKVCAVESRKPSNGITKRGKSLLEPSLATSGPSSGGGGGGGYRHNFNIFGIIEALFVLISTFPSEDLTKKNFELTSKIKDIEQLLEKSFILKKNNIAIYIIGTTTIKITSKVLIDSLKKNELKQKSNFKNTAIYSIAEYAPEMMLNLLLIKFFTEKNLNSLIMVRGGKISTFGKIITHLQNHKILIGSGLMLLLVLLFYNRKTISKLVFNLKTNHPDDFPKARRTNLSVRSSINKIKESLRGTINVETPHVESNELFNEIEFDLQKSLFQKLFEQMNKKSRKEFFEALYNELNSVEKKELGDLYRQFASHGSHEEHF